MIQFIKNILYPFFMVLYKCYVHFKYDVRFGKRVWIWYKQNIFEGKNFIGDNTKFISSHIGYASYISHDARVVKTKIGKYCSIGDGLKTHLGQHPSQDFVSTHPAFFSPSHEIGVSYATEQLFEEHQYTNDNKNFVVDIANDVWIGCNVIISDGIKIGNGAIIAAGAVVTKDVPAYAIVGGVPAKLIKYRFNEKQITFLENYKWWDKPVNQIKKDRVLFIDIEKFIKEIESKNVQ